MALSLFDFLKFSRFQEHNLICAGAATLNKKSSARRVILTNVIQLKGNKK
jgi:hypothetical protein